MKWIVSKGNSKIKAAYIYEQIITFCSIVSRTTKNRFKWQSHYGNSVMYSEIWKYEPRRWRSEINTGNIQDFKERIGNVDNSDFMEDLLLKVLNIAAW